MSYCESEESGGCLLFCDCEDCTDGEHCHRDCPGPPDEMCSGCRESYEARLDRDFDEKFVLGVV